MRIIIIFALLIVVISCASHRARKNIAYGKITIHGGVYENKEWSDKLTFKRTSWYQEASMEYDLMLTKLEETSPFASWMGSDQKYLKECKEFYISLIYAHVTASTPVSFMVDQLEKSGLKRIGVRNFTENLSAHDNWTDWRLSQYKVFGFCRPADSVEDIVVSVPGFMSIRI